MGSSLIECIVLGFIVLYLVVIAGSFLDPNEGRCKVSRRKRKYLFWGSGKQKFAVYNIIFQSINFGLTIFWSICGLLVKERELLIVLVRISYLSMIYITLFTNIIVDFIHAFHNEYKK